MVKDGALTKGQADSQVGCLSLWGRPRMLQDAHDVLIDPYKRLTASDMGAKPLLSRSAEISRVLQGVLPITSSMVRSPCCVPSAGQSWHTRPTCPDTKNSSRAGLLAFSTSCHHLSLRN